MIFELNETPIKLDKALCLKNSFLYLFFTVRFDGYDHFIEIEVYKVSSFDSLFYCLHCFVLIPQYHVWHVLLEINFIFEASVFCLGLFSVKFLSHSLVLGLDISSGD